MTSFASAFGSSDHEDYSLNNIEMNSTANGNDQEGLNHFSNVDLDQQLTSTKEVLSSSRSVNDAATLQTDSSSTAGAMLNIPSHGTESSSKSSTSNAMMNTSSTSTDQRISIPEMSRLSASSAAAVAAVGPKFDKLKQWSRSTYKCTKQSIYEKLGKTTRTVDVELDTKIEQFRETKQRYENMLALARSYANHFSHLMQTQQILSDQFMELKEKSSLLSDEFGYNAKTQRLLVQNGGTLFNALSYFISTLNTLCTKTMEDTMNTIRSYETARLEYDACRTEIQFLSAGSQSIEKEEELARYREKYEQYKCSVNVKLELLDENQAKVMKTQLLLFHNAIAAYFSGNKEALDIMMKQFNLKLTSDDQDKESFLEHSQH